MAFPLAPCLLASVPCSMAFGVAFLRHRPFVATQAVRRVLFAAPTGCTLTTPAVAVEPNRLFQEGTCASFAADGMATLPILSVGR